MSVEDALKLIVSLGVVVPECESGRSRGPRFADRDVPRNIAASFLPWQSCGCSLHRGPRQSRLLRHAQSLLRPGQRALIGQEIQVAGWVHRRRDHGGVIFVDLRDREGLLQVVFDPDNAAMFAEAERLRGEFVLTVAGLVRERPAGTANANLPRGKVELLARELDVLEPAEAAAVPARRAR